MISVAGDCGTLYSHPVAHPNIRQVTVEQMRQARMYYFSREEDISVLFPCSNKRFSLESGVAQLSVNPHLRGCLRAQRSFGGLFATAKSPCEPIRGEWRHPWYLYQVNYKSLGIPDNKLVAHQRDSQTHWLLDDTQSCYFPIPVASFFIRSLSIGSGRTASALTGATGFIDVRQGQTFQFDAESALGHGQWRWEMSRPRDLRQALADTVRFTQIERKEFLQALNQRKRTWFPKPEYSTW